MIFFHPNSLISRILSVDPGSEPKYQNLIQHSEYLEYRGKKRKRKKIFCLPKKE